MLSIQHLSGKVCQPLASAVHAGHFLPVGSSALWCWGGPSAKGDPCSFPWTTCRWEIIEHTMSKTIAAYMESFLTAVEFAAAHQKVTGSSFLLITFSVAPDISALIACLLMDSGKQEC